MGVETRYGNPVNNCDDSHHPTHKFTGKDWVKNLERSVEVINIIDEYKSSTNGNLQPTDEVAKPKPKYGKHGLLTSYLESDDQRKAAVKSVLDKTTVGELLRSGSRSLPERKQLTAKLKQRRDRWKRRGVI